MALITQPTRRRATFHDLTVSQVDRLTDDAVASAVATPPEDTRAWFRGTCLRRFPDAVAAANWDSVVFDLPGARRLVRVPTREPHRGTRALTEQLFAASDDAAALVRALGVDGTGPDGRGVRGGAAAGRGRGTIEP